MAGAKEEYERLLNRIFGTRIRWRRLTLTELEELAEALTGEGRCAVCDRIGCTRERYPLAELAARLAEERGGPVLQALAGLARALGVGPEDLDRAVEALLSKMLGEKAGSLEPERPEGEG